MWLRCFQAAQHSDGLCDLGEHGTKGRKTRRVAGGGRVIAFRHLFAPALRMVQRFPVEPWRGVGVKGLSQSPGAGLEAHSLPWGVLSSNISFPGGLRCGGHILAGVSGALATPGSCPDSDGMTCL